MAARYFLRAEGARRRTGGDYLAVVRARDDLLMYGFVILWQRDRVFYRSGVPRGCVAFVFALVVG